MSINNISLDISYVRDHFPAFKDPLCKDWVFSENAGGSYVPNEVIEKLSKFMISNKVQPYAEYPMSKIAGEMMDKATELFSDMINAISNKRQARCSLDLAIHVLEAMEGIIKSSDQRADYNLKTKPKQPDFLDESEIIKLKK